MIWEQLKDRARATGKPVIFVTDDQKEDWWHRSKSGQVYGPHPLLLQEMMREAKVAAYIYTADSFMERAA